jgi:hypothetical protein
MCVDSLLAIKNSVNNTMHVEHEDIMFWKDIADYRMYWKDETYMSYFMLDIVKTVR